MDKKEFLAALEKALGNMSVSEKQDILYDYDEHFSAGIEAGKSEQEIAEGLGTPALLARQFRADYLVKKAEDHKSTENILRAVLAIIGLGFFNLVIVLGPFLAAVGVLAGLLTAAVAVTAAGVFSFFAVIVSPLAFPFLPHNLVISNTATAMIGGMLLSLGISALGILMGIGVIYMIKWFYNLTIQYLKMNISIATNRRNNNE